ncbi:hypothetical protein GCM10010449_75410 [Streptomyces rectiviolaceus]|uniref:ATP-binding protein n=1 Tax=Streptomyces rectiviolaceus TaxID=332591 RepID=A0ABP6NFS4_9ACTN
MPHQAHLPALVGDTHADAALAELVSTALVTAVGSHYRLAAGVRTQLEASGYADDTAERAQGAAQHYAWWAGHPSVGPERVVAEADAVLAALSVLVAGQPASGAPTSSEESAAVLLARTVAPAFAGGLDWGAWERALRSGQEAARTAGEVAEEAYFHHELGILALCGGNLDRARVELEASIGLRGALADKRGMIAGRRALALVADRSGGVLPGGRTAAGEEVPDARYEESASPPGGVPAAFALPTPPPEPETLVTRKAAPVAGPGGPAPTRRSIVNGTRRNLVAAGAGALLAAVLGTVVTLGATSDNNDNPPDKVKTEQSASEDKDDDGLTADKPAKDSTSRPDSDGPDNVPGTEDDGTPSESGEPSDEPSDTGKPSDDTSKPPTTKPPTTKPPTTKPPTTKPPTTKPPTTKPPTTPPPTTPPPTTPTPDPPSSPDTSDSASGPASSPATSDSASGSASTI